MKFFYFIAGKFSYTFAVTLFLTLFGIIEILLAYIISATYLTYSFDKTSGLIIHILPLAVLAVTLIFFIISGFLSPLKIPALLKHYRKINNVFIKKMDVEIQDLKETYGNFSDLVMYNIVSSFFFVFLTGISVTGFVFYKYYVSAAVTLPVLKLIVRFIIMASVISVILFGMTSLILGEYLTYRERSELYNEIVKNGDVMKPYTLYSVSADFIFYVFILAIILITFTAQFNRIKNTDKNNMFILSYILGAVICIFYTARVHTKSIRRVLKDIVKVTGGIASGKKDGFRCLSLCRDFAVVQQTLMITAREMELSRQNLELIILERTDELEKALDTAREKEDHLRKQMDIAGTFQQNYKLVKPENWNELKFSFRHIKTKKLGGDYYDFFQLDDSKTVLIIADVQGNDIPASILTTMIKLFFNAAVYKSDSPGKILQEVNLNILTHFRYPCITDCFIAIIDDGYNCVYSSAGNMGSVILRKESDIPENLEKLNRALGEDEKNISFFKEGKTKLEYGDKFILYTDGIVLSHNQDDEEYSTERFLNSITNNRNLDNENYLNALLRDINNYRSGAESDNDTTLLVIELIPDEVYDLIKSSKRLISDFKYTEAVEILENGLEKYPGNLQILYNLGKNYLRIDNPASAVNFLEKYIESDNSNKYVFYVLGACFYQMMDYKKAIESFNSAISIDSCMIPALFALGMSYKNIGEYDFAVEILNKVSEIDTYNKMAPYEIMQINKLKNESLS